MFKSSVFVKLAIKAWNINPSAEPWKLLFILIWEDFLPYRKHNEALEEGI